MRSGRYDENNGDGRMGHREPLAMTDDNKLRLQNGMIAGVCGGLGEFFGINPWWVRIGFLLLLLPGGLPGLLPYVLLWIIIPRRQQL